MRFRGAESWRSKLGASCYNLGSVIARCDCAPQLSHFPQTLLATAHLTLKKNRANASVGEKIWRVPRISSLSYGKTRDGVLVDIVYSSCTGLPIFLLKIPVYVWAIVGTDFSVGVISWAESFAILWEKEPEIIPTEWAEVHSSFLRRVHLQLFKKQWWSFFLCSAFKKWWCRHYGIGCHAAPLTGDDTRFFFKEDWKIFGNFPQRLQLDPGAPIFQASKLLRDITCASTSILPNWQQKNAEKLCIISAEPKSLLNKKTEIVSTCRHRRKFLLSTYASSAT